MNTITETEYRQLKQEVETCREDAQRAKGALALLMAQLKREFGCDSLKDAKILLQQLKDKEDGLEEKFQRALKDYERKWKGAP